MSRFAGADGARGDVFRGRYARPPQGRGAGELRERARRAAKVPEPCRDPDLVYLYDGSLEGLLSAIFEAYARHENPGSVLVAEEAQLGYLQLAHDIVTDVDHARRVREGIIAVLGFVTFDDVERVFLSDEPSRGTIVYRFLRHALAIGPAVRDDLAHEDVQPFAELSVRVSNEAGHVREFLRFKEVEGGVLVARIHTWACVVPLIMGYFAARLGKQPFLICDDTHQLAGLWDGRCWVLCSTQGLEVPPLTSEERAQASLWRTFYNAVAVKQRVNEKLRTQLMPRRFWSDMTEFQQ